MRRINRESRPAAQGLFYLLYRYLFWGWLFKDLRETDPWLRAAARAYNLKQKICLPIYLRRWASLSCFQFIAGSLLEPSALLLAAVFFCSFAMSTCVLTTAAVSWLMLR